MMKPSIWRRLLLISVFVVFFVLGVLAVYQYGGLRQYIKASKYINEITEQEKREESWKNFIGTKKKIYSGIYGGKLLGLVWVWGKTGPRPFLPGKLAAYKYFDGCGKTAVPMAMKVSFNIDDWRKRAVVGDYIAVEIADSGLSMRIKEVFAYNFWPFIQKDQVTMCAK